MIGPDPTQAETPPEPLCLRGRWRFSPAERSAVIRALNEVRRRYPGPAGIILAREIDAFFVFGYRTDQTSPVPRLIAELNDTP